MFLRSLPTLGKRICSAQRREKFCAICEPQKGPASPIDRHAFPTSPTIVFIHQPTTTHQPTHMQLTPHCTQSFTHLVSLPHTPRAQWVALRGDDVGQPCPQVAGGGPRYERFCRRFTLVYRPTMVMLGVQTGASLISPKVPGYLSESEPAVL